MIFILKTVMSLNLIQILVTEENMHKSCDTIVWVFNLFSKEYSHKWRITHFQEKFNFIQIVEFL